MLPEGSYSLGQVKYAIGDHEAEAKLTIRRNAIEVKYYLLPLMLANPSTSSVTCKDNIHYIVVGQFYTNPIISDRSVADPTVIPAQDGRFYLYATQNSKDWMPIYSSTDLVNWKYEKNAFQKQLNLHGIRTMPFGRRKCNILMANMFFIIRMPR